MKILGIDASRSFKEKPTGVERYSTEIIEAILKLDKKVDIRLYTPGINPLFPKKIQKVIAWRRLWTVLGLSAEMRANKPDALFVPSHVMPFFAPENSFTMIHDLSFKKFPEAYSKFQRFYLNFNVARAVKICKKIFVPSEVVKEDLIKFFGAKKEKIRVIHHGPLGLAKHSELEEVSKKFGLGKNENIFFYLGRIEKKKNLETLVEAFRIVVKKFPYSKLVLGGSKGYGWRDIWKNFDSKIIHPGFLSEKDVSALFAVSTAFVLPSLDEGFGMPVLQAFEAGCPVICSSIPALCEVAENSALYAKNAKEFAEQMAQLIKNKELREEMILSGKERLKDFSWEAAAKDTMAEIEKNL